MEDEYEFPYSIQELIDNGMAWKMEGSIGRQCMAAIEVGAAMLGPTDHYDYYGNHIPSRYQVEPGTMGSMEYHKQWLEDRAQEIQAEEDLNEGEYDG